MEKCHQLSIQCCKRRQHPETRGIRADLFYPQDTATAQLLNCLSDLSPRDNKVQLLLPNSASSIWNPYWWGLGDPQNIPTLLSTGANSNVQGESQGAFSKPTPAHSTCLNSQCYALRWAQQYPPSISQLSCTPHTLALSQPDSWHSMPQKPVSATGDQTAKDTALAYCQCTLHWTPMAPPVGGGSIGGWTQTSASGCAWRDPISEVLATRHSMMGPPTQAWLQGGAPIIRGTQILFMSSHGGPLDHSVWPFT